MCNITQNGHQPSEHPESSIDSRLKIMDEIAGRIECAVSDNKNMYNQLQNYHQTLQQNNTVEQQLRECQLQQASIIQQILLQQKNGGSQNEQQKQLLDKFSLYTDQKPQKIKYICVACPQDGGASKKQRSSSRKISLKQDDSTILLEVQPEQTTPLKQKGSDSSTGSVSNKEELPCNEASKRRKQQKTSKISQQQHSSGLSQKQQQLSGLSQQQQIASNLSQQQQTTDVQDTLPFQQPATTDDLKQSMCQSSCQQDDLPPFDLNECRKMYQQRLQNIQMFHLVDAPSFEDPPAKKVVDR